MSNVKTLVTKKVFEKFAEKTNGCTAPELRERVEECLLAYGTVITKDGRVLTVHEMENLRLEDY